MFQAKPLRSEFSDYEPYISKEIMEVHYTKHYLGYLKNLNDAIGKHPEFFKLQIPQILTRIDELPEDIKEAVRNNGGGTMNHEIFWEILSTKETQIHEGEFKNAICDNFGDWDNFQEEFLTKGSRVFGSGWVWLVIGDNKKLQIITTPNQDSPYMSGTYPIFGIDLWEHSYYLQYKNMRIEYLSKIWKILDWKQIENRFTKSKH